MNIKGFVVVVDVTTGDVVVTLEVGAAVVGALVVDAVVVMFVAVVVVIIIVVVVRVVVNTVVVVVVVVDGWRQAIVPSLWEKINGSTQLHISCRSQTSGLLLIWLRKKRRED